MNEWLTQEWIRETLAAAEDEWGKSPYRALELNYVMGHEEWMNPKVREVYVTNFIARAAVRKVLLHVQEHINTYEIYHVLWEHYDKNGAWVPLQTKRVNLEEELSATNRKTEAC